MSAVASPVPGSPGGPLRWSVERYLAAAEAGIIDPEDRVELLEGEIIEKMGQDFPHIDGIEALIEALRAIFGDGYHVRSQLPQ